MVKNIALFFYRFICLCLLLLPFSTLANANWKIDHANSSVTFTAEQNNAPVKGQFTQFNGQLDFNSTQLDKSQVQFTIEMNSLTMSFAELTTILKAADWLDVAKYPQATFVSTTIKKIDDKNYEAHGELTIRDKKQTALAHFTLTEETANKLTVNGSMMIQRNQFGIGQGDWSNTDEIKDEVTIQFTLNATQ